MVGLHKSYDPEESFRPSPPCALPASGNSMAESKVFIVFVSWPWSNRYRGSMAFRRSHPAHFRPDRTHPDHGRSTHNGRMLFYERGEHFEARYTPCQYLSREA